MKATQEQLEYLDELRASGDINMFGAAAHLEEEFGLPLKEARAVLGEWMRTFSERHPKEAT